MGKRRFAIQIDKEKCTGCGVCEEMCSKVTRPKLCSGCGKCVGVCPSNAISLVERINNNKNHKKMKTRTKGFGHVILFLLAVAGFAAATMLLWNALLPEILGVASINFLQALGILALTRILFGGISPGAMKHMHKRHHSHVREKWMNMSPEQRLKFINRRRQFGFGARFGEDFFDMNEHEEAGKEND